MEFFKENNELLQDLEEVVFKKMEKVSYWEKKEDPMNVEQISIFL